MTTETARHRPATGLNAEEKRAWAGFYNRVRSEASLAKEIQAQLDQDAELKRMHLALYLCCRESLRLHQVREARIQRVAYAIRWLVHLLFAVPAKLLFGGLARSRDVAIAVLPEPAMQPSATPAVRPIVRHAASARKAMSDRPPKQSAG